MKGSMALLRAGVVAFALFAAGRAVYQNRDKLERECGRIKEAGGVKELVGDLSIGKVLNSMGSIRSIAGQLGHLK